MPFKKVKDLAEKNIERKKSYNPDLLEMTLSKAYNFIYFY
jgi:hypothetical protein